MPYAPGPDQARQQWFSAVCGDYTIPTNLATGSVVVQAKSGSKKDKKGAAGKNKSKTTKQGKQDVQITVEWEFTAQDWPDGPNGPGVETVLEYLDPNGLLSGGPFAFSHPDTDRRGVRSVTTKEIDPVVWKGWHGSVKITFDEWTEPQATGNAGAGGDATNTPDQADPANTGQSHGLHVGADGKIDTPGGGTKNPYNPGNAGAPNANP